MLVQAGHGFWSFATRTPRILNKISISVLPIYFQAFEAFPITHIYVFCMEISRETSFEYKF